MKIFDMDTMEEVSRVIQPGLCINYVIVLLVRRHPRLDLLIQLWKI